ncbi:MAG: fibronectin type III domain-containing protein, partial [Muribaculaceae bacterium]|nr:fibronectin type III domain-containing protein [Muribaculaceae bacterium]
DVTVAIPADGQFHSVRYNVAELWPAVAAKWSTGGANDKAIFTFAVVGSDLSSESAFYFTNVRYKDAVVMPQISAEAINITENSATLTWNATFPEGYTNTKVTVDGVEANGNSKELTGLNPNTEYTYAIVASGDLAGVTYSKTETVTFKTKRMPGTNPTWHGVTDKDGFSAVYGITYNDDKTLTVEAEIVTEKETPEADRNFHIFIGGDEWLKLHDNGAGILAGTTASKFEEGTTITWEWYLPYAGGVYQEANQYVVGSENEAPLSLRIRASVDNITTDGAEIAYDVTAPAGMDYKVYYKGAGDAVEATTNPIVLTGLAEKTEYTYEVYAVAGDLTSHSAVVTFTTKSASARNYVYAGVLNATFANAFRVGESDADRHDIAAELPWSVTYNDGDMTAVYSIDLTSVEDIVGLVPQLWSYGFFNLTKNNANGRWEYTFTNKTLNDNTAISHYLPYAGGVVDMPTGYTYWGMESEIIVPEKGLVMTASAEDVTTTTAKIAYSVKATEIDAYTVYYKLADGEAIEATASPIELTGLEEFTKYSYDVYAVAGDVESNHVTVEFTTKSSTARDYVYSDLFAAEFKNAFLPGETDADSRSFFVTLPWKVVYDTDGNAVYSVDLSQVKDIVGLVPQIYWNGFQTLTAKENGVYEYNFGQQELEATTAISHYFAYAGGVVDSRTPYTNWGMEKEAPAIGEATSLALSAAKKAAKINDKVRLSVVAKDANGYYLPVNSVKYDVKGGDFELDNSVFTAKATGIYTITAAAGNLTAETEIVILASSGSNNILAGKIGVTDEENIQGGSVENVTDDNLTSQLEWKCGDTEEHYLIYDLGDDFYIEGIDLLFEGAYATEFAVRLTNAKPAELESASSAAVRYMESGKQAADVVFANEKNDTQHYFIQKPAGTHRYVELRTSKALNTGWGIKVRDLKVYGSKDDPINSGVLTVGQDDANAPVEYYNLQGVRVYNPAAGQLVIRRQGNTVSKIVIR